MKRLVKIDFGSFIFVFNGATRRFLMIYVVLVALLDSTMANIRGEGPRNELHVLL